MKHTAENIISNRRARPYVSALSLRCAWVDIKPDPYKCSGFFWQLGRQTPLGLPLERALLWPGVTPCCTARSESKRQHPLDFLPSFPLTRPCSAAASLVRGSMACQALNQKSWPTTPKAPCESKARQMVRPDFFLFKGAAPPPRPAASHPRQWPPTSESALRLFGRGDPAPLQGLDHPALRSTWGSVQDCTKCSAK